MVPTDKFKEVNWMKYFEFRILLDFISNHKVFNFVDETHIYNHNRQMLRVCRNPITGEIPYIKVSGNFRDSQSMIAAISTNPNKRNKVFYTMSNDNNDSISFMLFIRTMIAYGFLRHNEVMVMDNCAIHYQNFAQNIR